MPVTAVPSPVSVNERSTARRNRPSLGRALVRASAAIEMRRQLGQALAGDGRDRDDRRALEARARQHGLDVGDSGGAPILAGEVALVEGDHAVPRAPAGP